MRFPCNVESFNYSVYMAILAYIWWYPCERGSVLNDSRVPSCSKTSCWLPLYLISINEHSLENNLPTATACLWRVAVTLRRKAARPKKDASEGSPCRNIRANQLFWSFMIFPYYHNFPVKACSALLRLVARIDGAFGHVLAKVLAVAAVNETPPDSGPHVDVWSEITNHNYWSMVEPQSGNLMRCWFQLRRPTSPTFNPLRIFEATVQLCQSRTTSEPQQLRF